MNISELAKGYKMPRKPGVSPSALSRRRKMIDPHSPLGRLLGVKGKT